MIIGVVIFIFTVLNEGFYGRSETIHILFVGNSLTYTNDLPQLVVQAGKKKKKKVKTTSLCFPDYGLEDHWNDKKVQKLISSEKFDYVVIQQGPSSQEEGRNMLMEYGRKIKDLCSKHKAQLVFFMVWPSSHHLNTFDGVIKNYADAARASEAILCPVGQVWKDYFNTTNDMSYYSHDGFHPSMKGSEVAAELLLNCLTETTILSK
ncbi:MAG TPA: SGNH/GDSL hydrolase family protein [Saprospiraceae bacterium]|nr:SGNH/GDSL hydrolase family protein [Saprospiraceae bacterium]